MAVKTRDPTDHFVRDPVAQDLDRTVAVIEDAAAALDEMLKYNQAMRSVAAQGVSHYRAEAEDARREAAALGRQVEQLESEMQALAESYEARVEALEQRIAEQRRELDSMRSLLWPAGREPR